MVAAIDVAAVIRSASRAPQGLHTRLNSPIQFQPSWGTSARIATGRMPTQPGALAEGSRGFAYDLMRHTMPMVMKKPTSMQDDASVCGPQLTLPDQGGLRMLNNLRWFSLQKDGQVMSMKSATRLRVGD